MSYEPQPDGWSAQIADLIQRIRAEATKRGRGGLVEPADLIGELKVEIGLPAGATSEADLTRVDPEGFLKAGEIEYLVREAFLRMEHDGLLAPTKASSGGGSSSSGAITKLARKLEWQGSSKNIWALDRPSVYTPTERLLSQHSSLWQVIPIQWPNVERLVEQARDAYQMSLDVAAAVTARVAVEEAVRSALESLGDPHPKMKAAGREDYLFEKHLKPKFFMPYTATQLDRTATRATLSVVRSRGNDAAHLGVVDNVLLQETFTLLLPKALASLSVAVAEVLHVK